MSRNTRNGYNLIILIDAVASVTSKLHLIFVDGVAPVPPRATRVDPQSCPESVQSASHRSRRTRRRLTSTAPPTHTQHCCCCVRKFAIQARMHTCARIMKKIIQTLSRVYSICSLLGQQLRSWTSAIIQAGRWNICPALSVLLRYPWATDPQTQREFTQTQGSYRIISDVRAEGQK